MPSFLLRVLFRDLTKIAEPEFVEPESTEPESDQSQSNLLSGFQNRESLDSI